MAEFVAAQASVLIVPTLGKGPNSFRTKLREQLRTVRESVDIEVKASTTKALAEIQTMKAAAEADPINLQVKIDKDGIKELRRSFTEIQHEYQNLRGDFRRGLSLNLKVVGLAQLHQLLPALASLNTSIVQLAQSALVLPGIFAGLGSTLATLVVGSRGLTDAFKAQSNAQKNSYDAAKQQATANRAVKDSTRDLNSAVKDAKRNIEDLNAQLRDAPLDEAEAMLNLQEAQYEASQKLGKSALEQQKDALRLRKAEGDLAETRRRNLRLGQDVAEANAKGVQGADAVVAAQERLTKALEDSAGKSSSVRDLADAMANLSPNAQKFVEAIRGLSGPMRDLRTQVQDRLFADLDADVTGLATRSLPMLQRGLGDISGGINGNLRAAIANLGSDSGQGFFERIFGNTADAQNLFSRAIDPMLDGLLRLSAAGSEYLPRLSDSFGDVMSRFDAFIARAEGDGSLDKWIDNGLRAMTQLGNSLLSVGSILNSVSDAFTGTGGKGLLELLESGTARLALFLKSAEGQSRMKQFFYEARSELVKWKPLLDDLPGIIGNVAEAGQAWSRLLLPFLTTAGSLLNEHPGLIKTIFSAYMLWKSVSPVIRGIKAALDSDMVGALKRAAAAVGTGYRSGGLTGALGAMGGLISPGGLIMGGLTLVAGYLANQYVTAQQEAAEATAAHADMISRLRSEMDGLSGDITSQGLIDKLNALSGYSDTYDTRNGRTYDIPGEAASKLGIDRAVLGQATLPTGQAARDQVMSIARQKLIESLMADSMYTRDGGFKSRLDTGNFSVENLADAIIGDRAQIDRYNQLGFIGAGHSLSDVKYGNNSPLPWLRTKGLNDTGLAAAQTGAAVMRESDNALSTGNQIRSNAQAVNGVAVLKPGNPFEQLGTPHAYFDTNGGGVISVDHAPTGQLLADIEKNGGRVEPNGNGGARIVLDKDRANVWLTRDGYGNGAGPGQFLPGFANGGLVGFNDGGSVSTKDRVMDFLFGPEYVELDGQMVQVSEMGVGGWKSLLGRASLRSPKINPGTRYGASPTSANGKVNLSRYPERTLGGDLNNKVAQAGSSETAGWFDNAYEFLSNIPGLDFLPGRAYGGILRGPGSGTSDSMLARVSNGEYVLRADAVSKYGTSFIDQLNAGALPAFSEGSPGGVSVPWLPTPGGANAVGSLSPGNPLGILAPKAPAGPLGDRGAQVISGPLPANGWKPASGSGPVGPLTGSALTDPGLTGSGPLGKPVLDFTPVSAALPSDPKLGIDGDNGNVSALPPSTQAQITAHGGANGAYPGPAEFAGSGPGSLFGNSSSGGDTSGGFLDFLKPDKIGDFLADQFKNIGSTLLDVGLGFLSGITGFDFKGLLSPFLQVGNHFAGLVGDSSKGGPSEANPDVQKTLDGYSSPKSDYLGTSIYSSSGSAGAQRAANMADLMAGKPYSFGGGGLDGTDCSGLVMYVADAYIGKEFSGRSGGTGTEAETLTAKGAVVIDDPSLAPSGTLRIGWRNGGAGGGHTAGTLPDGRNFEASTYGQPIAVGSGASGYNSSQFDHWAYFPAFANGGLLSGPGTGTSDSMLARLSNGEFVTKAASVAKYGRGFFDALNAGKVDPGHLPGFADGTPPLKTPVPPTPPPVEKPVPPTPPPVDPLVQPDPAGSAGQLMSGAADALGTVSAVGAAPDLGHAPQTDPGADPRAVLGAAPASQDHNAPWLSKGIEGAASTIGAVIGTAASAAAAGASGGAGAAGAGAAGSIAAGGAQIAGQAISGGVNILSSLLVGTLTGGSTPSAYGAPVLPQQPSGGAPAGPSVVNNYGDIHTASYDQFHQGQLRREQQQAQPFFTPK